MKIKDLRKGDIITYQNGRINYVNKPKNYYIWFDDNFYNKELDVEIVKIQRYVKTLCFYRLKTIYERGKTK